MYLLMGQIGDTILEAINIIQEQLSSNKTKELYCSQTFSCWDSEMNPLMKKELDIGLKKFVLAIEYRQRAYNIYLYF